MKSNEMESKTILIYLSFKPAALRIHLILTWIFLLFLCIVLGCFSATRIQINAFLSGSGSGQRNGSGSGSGAGIEVDPDPHPAKCSGSGSATLLYTIVA